jgi:hypothetical protein
MNLSGKRSWISAILLAGVAMLFGQDRVQAAGITVSKAHSTPIGDPLFEYYFAIDITASQGDQFVTNSYITISNLDGIYKVPGVSAGTLLDDWYGQVTGTGTVKFTYIGSGISTDVNFDVSNFFAGLTTTFPANDPPTPMINYTGTAPTGNGGTETISSGSVQVTYVASIVPEPSSLVLLVSGASLAPVIWFRRRYRKSPMSSAI